MTKARTIADLGTGFVNISDTGTEGTKVATGTTAQRGSTTGQWRFNSTTGFFEGRNATEFTSLEPTPTITSVDVSEVDSAGGGNQTIVVTGSNFSSGGTISFRGSSANFDATTTTFDSVIQVTAVAPKSSFLNAQEPYTVRFTASTGTFGEKSGLINVDSSPTWNTASGSLGSVFDSARSGLSFSATATDADGDTITYSVQSGSLPSGLSLNSSTGAITGTANAVGSDTTSNFTLRATAGSKTVDRAFSITIKAPVSTTYSYTGSNQTFTVPTGLTLITLDIKGAGGQGGVGNSGSGGTGGRTQGNLTVSGGQSYIIVVGGSSGNTYGGGGNSANSNAGDGGGYSGIFLTSVSQSNAKAIAGGGGGSGYGGNNGGSGGGTSGNSGDGGGGSEGQGGTQSAGGTGGGGQSSYSGSALQGGNSNGGNAGGGGGGYFGGGGGIQASNDGAGGGGSGYTGGLESGATTTTGGGNGSNTAGSLVISY
jgi:hypothetical protein